jgi:hypothetical protein
MLEARVEQKDGRKQEMVCATLDKESPIQAVCGNFACTDLSGGGQQWPSLPHL